MVEGISAISNPTLGYKLDPGEPGLSNSAPASRSVLRVLTQELSNYYAFQREALRQGGFIISGGISLDFRKRGSFLAAVAGKTKVWMYIPKSNPWEKPEDTKTNDEGSQDVSKTDISEKIRELRLKLQTTKDPVEIEKIEREILLLEMAMNALMLGMNLPKFLIGTLFDQIA
ncbi:hypothetical protein JYK00_03480 [Thermosipho ferrireducens]|uniref:Uncharacterized protein n=1 Tax=Thermosipho ferrireducens TaxID=2571116 RepID=A0ABX7S9N1_9BACT|nr:hypothetical protein [Thermosipho ferrireducens]QTA38585.1 hypothetical protein JYK00_03480 [Thermosipho ferrireducens]